MAWPSWLTVGYPGQDAGQDKGVQGSTATCRGDAAWGDAAVARRGVRRCLAIAALDVIQELDDPVVDHISDHLRAGRSKGPARFAGQNEVWQADEVCIWLKPGRPVGQAGGRVGQQGDQAAPQAGP